MNRDFIKILLFFIGGLLTFLYVGYIVHETSGGGVAKAFIGGVSPEAGENIFWGKGKCWTCHAVSGRGGASRCPNLGIKDASYTLDLEMGARASERAKEREAEVGVSPLSGNKWNAVEYLYECIAEPDSHVVDTFSPGVMPIVYKPPIGLNEEEIKAVIAYMVSLGGEDADMDYLMSHGLPRKIVDAVASAAKEEPFRPYFEGDVEYGAELFWDPDSVVACAKCHAVGERGGKIGPDLTNIAATQTPQYILESILDPNAVIVNGFETVLIITKDGRYIDGIDKGHDSEFHSVLNAEGEIMKIPLSEVEEVAPQSTSMMPGNFRELMTVDEFHHILAYVLSLTGEDSEGETIERNMSETGVMEAGAS